MITQQLIQLLKRKGNKAILVSRQTLANWESDKNKPNLRSLEKIIEENNYDVFISDGNLDDLIEFNKKVAKKKGLKLELIFRV